MSSFPFFSLFSFTPAVPPYLILFFPPICPFSPLEIQRVDLQQHLCDTWSPEIVSGEKEATTTNLEHELE